MSLNLFRQIESLQRSTFLTKKKKLHEMAFFYEAIAFA